MNIAVDIYHKNKGFDWLGLCLSLVYQTGMSKFVEYKNKIQANEFDDYQRVLWKFITSVFGYPNSGLCVTGEVVQLDFDE